MNKAYLKANIVQHFWPNDVAQHGLYFNKGFGLLYLKQPTCVEENPPKLLRCFDSHLTILRISAMESSCLR